MEAVSQEEKRRAYNRAYYAKTRDAQNEASKRYYREHRDEIRERRRIYHFENREKQLEKMRVYGKASRARRLGLAREKRYGLTQGEFDALLFSQGYKCAACGEDKATAKQDWHLDHCHSTKKVRGILCPHCNVAIGYAKDSPEKLRRMADYLERVNGQDQ